MRSGLNGIYYGWVIVAIAFVGALLTTSSGMYSFGILTHPVSAEFGLSRATFNSGFIIFSIGTGIFSPIVGALADRFPIRWIFLTGAMLFGGSQIILSQSTSLPLDAVLIAVPFTMGFAMSGTLIGYVLVARWFTARRGRAMAIAAIGQSAGGILGTPIIAALVQYLGWRPALLITGMTVVAILFVIGLFVVDRPRAGESDDPLAVDAAASPAGHARSPEVQWTVAQLLRSGRFWTLFVAVSGIISVVSTLVVTLVPYGIEQGLTPITAAGLITCVAISGITAKFGLAVIADRFARSTLLAIGAIVLAAFNFALMLEPPYAMLVPTCIVAGFSIGTAYPLVAAIVADRFGTRSYGTAMGLLSPGISFSTAIASRFLGEVFDRTGNYDLAFITFIGLLIFSAGLLLFSDRRTIRPMPVAAGFASA